MFDDGIEFDVATTGEVVVVTISGELDLVSSSALQAVLHEYSPEQHVVLDCAGIQFIDSTGLGLILSQSICRERSGGSLQLRNTSFTVRHVVETTGQIQLIEPEAAFSYEPTAGD